MIPDKYCTRCMGTGRFRRLALRDDGTPYQTDLRCPCRRKLCSCRGCFLTSIQLRKYHLETLLDALGDWLDSNVPDEYKDAHGTVLDPRDATPRDFTTQDVEVTATLDVHNELETLLRAHLRLVEEEGKRHE